MRVVEQHLIYSFNPDVLVKVACGYTHTLALTETGEVYAWGGNIYGELNLDKNVVKNNPSPVKVYINYLLL